MFSFTYTSAVEIRDRRHSTSLVTCRPTPQWHLHSDAPRSLLPRHCLVSILSGIYLSDIHAVCWMTIRRLVLVVHQGSCTAPTRRTIWNDTRFQQHCKAHPMRHVAHHLGSSPIVQLRLQIDTATPLRPPVHTWFIIQGSFPTLLWPHVLSLRPRR